MLLLFMKNCAIMIVSNINVYGDHRMKRADFNFENISENLTVPVGGIVELRDFSKYIPKATDDSLSWELKEYRLLDSTYGKMLYVNEKMPITPDTPYDSIDFSTNGMPHEIVIDVPLKGKYKIYACMPVMDFVSGVDLALNDEGFVLVSPEYGARRGRMLGLERGREYCLFWRKAYLNGSKIRIRVPFGTFSAFDLSVHALLSCLRFEKVEESESLAPVDKGDKDFIMICDGFSHYCGYGVPGECLDLRLNRLYADSDVRIFMHQVMGPLLWKSDVNSYLGEGMKPKDYVGKRICDVRNIKYVKDSIENCYEALRLQTEDCHRWGAEMHFSIRANLYFPDETKYMKGEGFLNGRWWHEHPECRLPDSCLLDYGKREVRDYYYSVYRDVLERFDVDGINLDLTRWPSCLSKELHTPQLLVDICKDLRSLADEYSEKRNKHIQVSLLIVEYYHSYMSLEDQVIDFEAIAKSKTLDFICVETDEIEKFVPVAHENGLKIHGIIDTGSPYYNNAEKDPLWALPDGTVCDDPCAGDEFKEQPLMTQPAPFEHYFTMNKYYQSGADGIAKVNSFMGTPYFRDCGHSDRVKLHAEDESVFGQEKGQYFFFI